jgi:hypothetical protein
MQSLFVFTAMVCYLQYLAVEVVMCQHLSHEASSAPVSCDLMVVLGGLTLHPQQPSQKGGDLAAGSKSIILLWQYMAGRLKCRTPHLDSESGICFSRHIFQGMWFHIKCLAFREGLWIWHYSSHTIIVRCEKLKVENGNCDQ